MHAGLAICLDMKTSAMTSAHAYAHAPTPGPRHTPMPTPPLPPRTHAKDVRSLLRLTTEAKPRCASSHSPIKKRAGCLEAQWRYLRRAEDLLFTQPRPLALRLTAIRRPRMEATPAPRRVGCGVVERRAERTRPLAAFLRRARGRTGRRTTRVVLDVADGYRAVSVVRKGDLHRRNSVTADARHGRSGGRTRPVPARPARPARPVGHPASHHRGRLRPTSS